MTFETLNPPATRARMDAEDWVFVDVRTVEEFDQGHVPGAWNIPFAFRSPAGGMAPNPDFVDVIKRRFPLDAHLVFGWASGGRSQRACGLLEAEGFTHMINMDGGFTGKRDELGQVVEEGWMGCGFPTEGAADAERTWEKLKSAWVARR